MAERAAETADSQAANARLPGPRYACTMGGAGAHQPEEWRDRADAVLRAVTGPRRFDARRGLFGTRRLLAARSYAHLWPFACAWSAMETASGLAGPAGARAAAAAAACTAGLGAYAPAARGETPGGAGPIGFESSVTAPLGRGGEVYYDDNAWVALALLEHHRRHRDPASLALARRVVAFCLTGWSTDPGWSHPGGIRWKVPAASRSRNTCANAPLAEAAVLVHLHGGDPGALEWAVRIYEWVRAALLGDDGLYLDRIMPDGTRAEERWSYNQGTMIGAGVLLAEATGEERYLAQAEATAAGVLDRYDAATLVRADGPAFNAIFFRNVFLLDQKVPDARLRALATAYGTCTWEERPRHVGCFGSRRPALNAMAPLVELYALLAGATPHA